MPNRALTHLAVGALAVLPVCGLAGPALAGERAPLSGDQSTSSTPPPGTAEANALLVDPLLAIAHTRATAGNGSGSATGNAVELGGEPLVEGMTGGTQQGAGSSEGSLLDTGVTPLGQLQLTPWGATVTSTGDKTTADGDAALLRLFLVDPTVLRAAVLQSHSHAESDSNGTSSSSSSDGATVDAGDGALSIGVLHAESSSSSGGHSYLVSVNGNEIGSSDDANGSCALDVPSVVSLSCLTATGGPGAAAAAVGEATLGGGQAGGTVVGTKATGQAVTQGSGPAPTTASASSDSSGALPFTGSSLPPIVALGTFAVAAGAWLQQASRRMRGTA
jgi:hypothetical protein